MSTLHKPTDTSPNARNSLPSEGANPADGSTRSVHGGGGGHTRSLAGEPSNFREAPQANTLSVGSREMTPSARSSEVPMARPTPNFVILDGGLPDIGRLVAEIGRAHV